MESLLFLNEHSAKFMDWQVRIIHPRITQYQFTTKRNDTVNATRFQAYLVGANPLEYVQATVPFSFKDESKTLRASEKFASHTCWNLQSVTLDPNSKPQWNGCPNKAVVVLEPPTTMNPLMRSSKEEKALALYIEPPMRLVDILKIQFTQTVDCAVVIQEVPVHRLEVSKGKQVSVCSIIVVDDSNSRASITCWEDQALSVQGLDGQPATFLGLTVLRENGEVRLNFRTTGLLDYTNNPRHQQLSEYWNAKNVAAELKVTQLIWLACSQKTANGCSSMLC